MWNDRQDLCKFLAFEIISVVLCVRSSVCPSIRRALRQKCESLPGEFGGMTDTLAEKVIAL